MCWSIKKIDYESNPEKYHKIADKNITVYKFGHGICNEFHPAFQISFGYEPNVLKEENKLVFTENSLFTGISDTWYEIGKGYHSYSEDCSIGLFNSLDAYTLTFSVLTKGEKIGIRQYANVVIGRFIIPKGTEYYENEDGEIVSSNIMWTGEYYATTNIKEECKFKDIELCVG